MTATVALPPPPGKTHSPPAIMHAVFTTISPVRLRSPPSAPASPLQPYPTGSVFPPGSSGDRVRWHACPCAWSVSGGLSGGSSTKATSSAAGEAPGNGTAFLSAQPEPVVDAMYAPPPMRWVHSQWLKRISLCQGTLGAVGDCSACMFACAMGSPSEGPMHVHRFSGCDPVYEIELTSMHCVRAVPAGNALQETEARPQVLILQLTARHERLHHALHA